MLEEQAELKSEQKNAANKAKSDEVRASWDDGSDYYYEPDGSEIDEVISLQRVC